MNANTTAATALDIVTVLDSYGWVSAELHTTNEVLARQIVAEANHRGVSIRRSIEAAHRAEVDAQVWTVYVHRDDVANYGLAPITRLVAAATESADLDLQLISGPDSFYDGDRVELEEALLEAVSA